MRLRRSFLGLALFSPCMLLSSAIGVQQYSISSFAPAQAPSAAPIRETLPAANSQPVPYATPGPILDPFATPSPSLVPAANQDPTLPPAQLDSLGNVPSGQAFPHSLNSRDVGSTLQGWMMTDAAVGSQVRFVVFGGIDQERRRSICEDSAVFHHMLTKDIPQWNRSALGVTVYSQQEPYAWYVEDHGLVMFFQVPRPVAPGGSAEEDAKDEPRELTAWERAKQEMQGHNRNRYNQAVLGYALGQTQSGYAYYPRADQVMQYDADFASALDKVVTAALQQVGNFRDLAKDDSVTVFVYGPSANPASGGRSVYAWRVRLSDIRGDEPVSAEAIERRQYSETEPASQPLTAPMPSGPTAR